jgi:hypothetical protein
MSQLLAFVFYNHGWPDVGPLALMLTAAWVLIAATYLALAGLGRHTPTQLSFVGPGPSYHWAAWALPLVVLAGCLWAFNNL